MTVSECRERVDSREFSEWMAFYELDPWGKVERPAPAEQAKAQLAHNAFTAWNMALMAGKK